MVYPTSIFSPVPDDPEWPRLWGMEKIKMEGKVVEKDVQAHTRAEVVETMSFASDTSVSTRSEPKQNLPGRRVV